jgi:hypothetical protein
MLTLHQFEEHFNFVPQSLFDIALEIRNLVAKIDPNATEVLRRKGIVYFDASRGGPVSAGICQILIFPDHIRLAFIHGALLPDPENLLGGGSRYKKYVKLTSYENTPWEAVENLIKASNSYDPYTRTFVVR